MEDIPQPSRDSYSVGEKVQVYISPIDLDSRFHGAVCEVVDVRVDDLDSETGRSTDAYSYTLQYADSENILPMSFRHQDLTPVEDTD